MKIIYSLIFISALCLSCTSLNAQSGNPFTLGIKAGANISNFSGKGVEESDAKAGFIGGVTVDYRISAELFLLSGLEFVMKGAKDEGYYYFDNINGLSYSGKINYNPMYLQLPVHIGYKIPIFYNVNATIHAGPYLAYGIGGKVKPEDLIATELLYTHKRVEATSTDEFDFFGDDAYKKFDYGLGLGVNFEFNKIVVGIGYDFGLANLSRDSKYKVKTMNAYLVAGYKF